ncbi:exodeoxyribonuclease VII large subunit [Neisseria leonii]|uniref:Exodeoxyribonuclease 7 large subunit n=1 Tax=Neisseria leonii TaxID=2995413 RepID=A0A9X4E0Z2_9NEIS|nr:exodeoxyribonuclease VII large subunit [Neisseria sp. 51.81]MDD9327426.1 exodeoxyribonuclease VII large subunit [Neisseria sp. 51.81]
MSDFFAPAALSVSELNALTRGLLEDHLAGLWVAGEVSNLTKAASGHYYFALKDSRAQVRCAMFKGAAARLAAPLKEGDQIEVSGRITLYEARGEFQISVAEVRLKGLGQLYEAYGRLKSRLQAEGLFAPEKKRPLPFPPRAVGIVTSPAAAALRDVVSTLRRRAPDIPVIVYPTPVQGTGSAMQIAQAVQTAARRAEADVLIVCRGGGSMEDLWSFNEEAVARALAECPIPTVSGVGHETDFTLADFAADVRAPTPTAAAELVSPNRQERIRQLAQHTGRLKTALQRRYSDAAQKTDWLARQIRHPADKLRDQRRQTGALAQQMRHALLHMYAAKRQTLNHAAAQLAHGRPDTESRRRQTAQFQTALLNSRRRLTETRRQALAQQAALLQAVSPQHILARGFAVVKDTRGQVVRDAAALHQGQKLHIVLAEGEIGVRVSGGTAQPDLFDFS